MKSTDRKTIYSIIKKNCLHAYVATCDRGQPVIRPMSPIVEPDLSVWLVTHPCTRKVKHIRQNPRVCVAFVDQPRGNRAATFLGRVRFINDLRTKRRVWKLSPYDLGQYIPDGPASKDFCLMKVVPRVIEWRARWTQDLKECRP